MPSPAPARPAPHEPVALVAVGEDGGLGRDDGAGPVEHAEAHRAGGAAAVVQQVDQGHVVDEPDPQLLRVPQHGLVTSCSQSAIRQGMRSAQRT